MCNLAKQAVVDYFKIKAPLPAEVCLVPSKRLTLNYSVKIISNQYLSLAWELQYNLV